MCQQKGFALIVSLVLLFVGIMLAISAAQSARLEEAMAGNHRSYAFSLMAADSGAAAWLDDPPDLSSYTIPDCSSYPDDPVWSVSVLSGSADPARLSGVDVSYEVAMCKMAGLAYKVKSRGKVVSGGDVLSFRDIVLEAFILSPGFLNFSPINIASDLAGFGAANSNFSVDGDYNDGDLRPAISAGSKVNAKDIVDDILGKNPKDDSYFVTEGCEGPPEDGCADGSDIPDKDMVRYECNPSVSGNNRLCNYDGGVTSEAASGIFKDENVDEFAEFIEEIVGKHSRDEIKESDEYLDGTLSASDLPAKLDANGNTVKYYDNLVSAKDMDNEIVFVSSNSPIVSGERNSFEYNGAFSGSGILIVDGDVGFGGVPSFTGLIIVLGDYVVSGGGGGEYKGSVISLGYGCDSNAPSDCDKESVQVSIGGGGSASYNYDIDALNAAYSLVTVDAKAILEGVDEPASGDVRFAARKWSEQIHDL